MSDTPQRSFAEFFETEYLQRFRETVMPGFDFQFYGNSIDWKLEQKLKDFCKFENGQDDFLAPLVAAIFVYENVSSCSFAFDIYKNIIEDWIKKNIKEEGFELAAFAFEHGFQLRDVQGVIVSHLALFMKDQGFDQEAINKILYIQPDRGDAGYESAILFPLEPDFSAEDLKGALIKYGITVFKSECPVLMDSLNDPELSYNAECELTEYLNNPDHNPFNFLIAGLVMFREACAESESSISSGVMHMNGWLQDYFFHGDDIDPYLDYAGIERSYFQSMMIAFINDYASRPNFSTYMEGNVFVAAYFDMKDLTIQGIKSEDVKPDDISDGFETAAAGGLGFKGKRPEDDEIIDDNVLSADTLEF